MKKCISLQFVLPSCPVLCFLLTFLTCGSGWAQFTLDREPAGPSSRKTGLVITEIMYNPLPVSGQDTNHTLEFIELYNSQPWIKDISGYTIAGDVQYTFPSNSSMAAHAYLVLARVPDLIESVYDITNVVGPWDGAETNRLSIDRGTVQLRNQLGAVLLSVDYRDSPPWPEAADGSGHSLSLVRPSYGENDFQAWAESDTVGGSPGGPDPVTQDPLASVLINEWQNHSDPVDWLELYNHGNTPVNVGGAYLSDAPTSNFFRIPDGTTIPARGFLTYDQNQLGFELFAGGESVFLWSTNRARILDAIDFRGQSNNVTSGRSPDGGPFLYGLAQGTRGAPNSAPMRYPVIINEIMYNPISGNSDDEYVEIYNRGDKPADLSGWEFIVGISYVFPTNSITTRMPPGAYWVVAKNPANLMAIYPNLTTNNTFGPYGGTLSNGGERVVLASADYDNVSSGGMTTVVKLNVPVSDITYADGGKWGQWSDGSGSSLELIDPEADERFPSNWADSNDTGESQWTDIEMEVPLGESLGSPINDSLNVMLEGVGECLLDEVEVRADNGPNLVANGGFEDGLNGWSLQGSHDFSTVEDEGFSGTKSLHIRAASRGENQSNRILSAPFEHPIPPGTRLVSLRAKARWLRGFPELLLRLHGSATEAFGRMALPRHLGTPGMVNSRYAGNLGPAVYGVKHAPLLPAPDEAVVVTARARDPQGLAAMTLHYRVDPTTAYTDLSMHDNGTGGDAIAGDGVYSATLPPQAAGVMVAFYVEGRDTLNASGTFPRQVFPLPGLARCWPNDAVARECVVRWGEVQMPGDFASYHLWITSGNSNRWHVRDAMNNADMDGTFIYNNSRVIYDALPLYSGSPWHRTNSTTGPAGPNRVDYEMNFPDDDQLLGTTDFVLNNTGNPDVLTVSDLSAMNEQIVYKIFEGLGLPNNHRRYIHFFVNGNQRSTAYERPGNFIFEDSQQPDGDMIDEWFPNDAGGQLFKVEDWFEFEPNGFDVEANNDADLERRTVPVNGQPTLLAAPYRFMYRKRSIGVGNSANDYSLIFDLINAASPPDDPNGATIDPVLLSTTVDWEAWMRFFALHRTIGNFDSYGWERGKNDYLYQTSAGLVHMPWDIDYGLGLGRPANEPLFASNDPRILAMFNTPEIVRAYWRAFQDIVNGPLRNEYLDPIMDARAAALTANNVNFDPDAEAAIKSYITDRRAYLESQLATVAAPFAVEGPPSFSTDDNLLILTGTAPVGVKEIALNGVAYPVTWTTVTNFTMRLVLEPDLNALNLQGLDRFGQPLLEATQDLSVTYTGPVVDPVGVLVISEIMTDPVTPGAQFVEIMNRSEQNFGLSGWRLDGLNFTFPVGSILTNKQIVVLARSRTEFNAAYGRIPLAGLFGPALSFQGQTLALVRPGLEGDTVVDAVRYEGNAPWPLPSTGVSLQLVDEAQDNARAANWAVDPVELATPGAPNSVAATLAPFDPLWLNEVQTENISGPDDNVGDREPWIELYNAGPAPLSLEGYYLAQSYTSNLMEWPFPVGASIAPGEFKLIWADGEPEESAGAEIHTDFHLDYSGKLALVRLVDNQPQITDYLTWITPGANASYGDFPDGQPVFRFTLHQPTAGATNVQPVLPVYINEWLARNTLTWRDPADNDYEDWFELYNGGATTVDLGDFYLSDDPLDWTKFQIPANGQYRIPPGGFLLVWADDETDQNGGNQPDLHVNFKLSGSAGAISLYAPDGQTPVDAITYGAQTDDVSEGRYTDGASMLYLMPKPTPGGRNTAPGVNTPPAFPPIPQQFLYPGERLTFNIAASDPEIPGQILSYSLIDPPPGAAVNSSGLFRWIVPDTQPPGDYLITVVATDNGVPPRSGTTTFIFTILGPTVTLTPPPVIRTLSNIRGQATFTFEAVPGHTYRILYKDNLEDADWTPLDRDFVAANAIASITDPGMVAHRFYRVVQLD
jgi:Lamin Tail Domain/CotH kinase protein